MAKKDNKSTVLNSSRTLRAVEAFECIGGDCEDTCCQSWKVSLTKTDYVTWKNLARRQPEEFKLFEKHVPKGGGFFATLEFDKDTGGCPFQDKTGLCRVQSKLGASALPGTCRTFPRVYTLDASSLQASASLGCPEYTRHVLASDEATDVVDGRVPDPSATIMKLNSSGDAWHWQRNLPELGELGLSIVKSKSPHATLSERIFVLLMMMRQLDGKGDSPENPLPLPQMSQLVLPYLDDKHRAEVVTQYQQTVVPPSNLALSMVYALFAYRLTMEWEYMSTLWDDIHASYAHVVPAELTVVPGKSLQVEVGSIAPVFEKRRRQLHARAGKQLMQWYERAFCNQFYNGGGAAEESPSAYLGRHVATILMFDFAICSHRAVDELIAGEGPLSAEEYSLLAKHVVDVMHRVGRTILHVGKLTTAMASIMEEQQVDSFALVTALLKDLGSVQSVGSIRLSPLAAAMSR